MNSSDQTPKLPMWVFFLIDVVLLATAWFVATASARPLSTQATFTIFACIFGGALIVLVPLISRFERQKNESLDERQREFEAVARTISAAAEQVSIAAAGLHEIAELTQKNLRHADQLPHRLQEKIAEFQAQLNGASDASREELEKELEYLRSSESERLESIATKIAKSAAEWARLETATQQQLSAVTAAIEKLSSGSVATILKAQAAAEHALGQARADAARAHGEASSEAAQAIEVAKSIALAQIEARLATAATRPAAVSEPVIAITAAEPPPVLTEKIAEITPVVPNTLDPFLPPPATDSAPAPAPDSLPTTAHGNGETAVPAAPKAARKRTPKPPAPPVPDLGIEESVREAEPPEAFRTGEVERVMTSDGATRLIVTAYIGIGNRLHIRGDGPGLSWDKGVPLQFVSIGKWRWETNEASGPVTYKLFKNDDLECSAVGTQVLDPGHQQEVTAAF
jgi:hypothetical protein